MKKIRKIIKIASIFYSVFIYSIVLAKDNYIEEVPLIHVHSSVGEPLLAKVELTSFEKKNKDYIKVKLASKNAFLGAGLEYPPKLKHLYFVLKKYDSGEEYLEVS